MTRRTIDIQVVSSSLKWLLRIMGSRTKGIVMIGMQDKSELLLRELDSDFFGAQDDSEAGIAAASPAGESYESEDHSSDEDAPTAWRVYLGTSLVHCRVWER